MPVGSLPGAGLLNHKYRYYGTRLSLFRRYLVRTGGGTITGVISLKLYRYSTLESTVALVPVPGTTYNGTLPGEGNEAVRYGTGIGT